MKFLTIDDVCKMLSISRRTLERMRVSSLQKRLKSSSVVPDIRDSVEDTEYASRDGQRIPFPEPDLYIGKSPRWEMDKLLVWLKKNGGQL